MNTNTERNLQILQSQEVADLYTIPDFDLEALAAKKAKGIRLGKPKGTIQKSMYDKDLETIKGWLALGLSGRKISENLGYGSYISLNTFLKKRKLRKIRIED